MWDRVIWGWGVVHVHLRDMLVVVLIAHRGFTVMVWAWWWAFMWVGGRHCPWALVVHGSVGQQVVVVVKQWWWWSRLSGGDGGCRRAVVVVVKVKQCWWWRSSPVVVELGVSAWWW